MKVDINNTDKKYAIIYADPPWRYTDNGCHGACEKHYDTMTLEDLCNLPIRDLAADDCVLFLWATYPMLPEALKVIKAWGFRYKTIAFQWVKLNKKCRSFFFGLGRWTRGNTEPCLLAIKGHPRRINASVGQLIISPIDSHSRKPPQTRDRILRLMGDLQRIELFARDVVPGWDCWGNEVPEIEQLRLEKNSFKG